MSDFRKQLAITTQIAQQVMKEMDKEIDTIVSLSIETPSYDEMVKKSEFYNGYAELVDNHGKTLRLIMKSNKMILALKDVQNSLQITDSTPMSLVKSYREALQTLLNGLSERTKILRDYQLSLETFIKFYNTATYVLGSNRMGID